MERRLATVDKQEGWHPSQRSTVQFTESFHSYAAREYGERRVKLMLMNHEHASHIRPSII